MATGQEEHREYPGPSERKFTGPNNVLAGELAPGDLVRFKHYATEIGDALVIGVDDTYIHTISLTGRAVGFAASGFLSDGGLKPYEEDDGSTWWNDANHTERLEGHFSPTPPSYDQAWRLNELFRRIEEAQFAHDAIPASPPTMEEIVVRAMIECSLGEGGHINPNHPLAPGNIFSH